MEASAKKIQPQPDTLIRASLRSTLRASLRLFKIVPDDFVSVSPVNKGITHNEEQPTMDINDLFEGIMKSINQFADEIAEQRLQEKMLETGRGPENRGKNSKNFQPKEKPSMQNFPKRE